MLPIRIIDKDFNFLGELDTYESVIFERSLYGVGKFEINLSIGERTDLSIIQEDNIIIIGNDEKKAGIIKYVSLSQTENETMTIKGSQLKNVIGRRITVPPGGQAYDAVTANAETVIKGYVDRNCVNPVDPNRTISKIQIAANQNRGISTSYQTRFKKLNEEIAKISKAAELGWTMELDTANNVWIFDVKEVIDKTAGQSTNPPLIFSIDFDNVDKQGLINDNQNKKTTAIVAGKGEGIEREIVEVNNTFSDLEREELFVDARDLEDLGDLGTRGEQKLSELSSIKSFECEIKPFANLEYQVDWDLGDKATVSNRKWNVTLDSIITSVKEIYEEDGFKVFATFGNKVPTLIDKVKNETDIPMIENGFLTWDKIDNTPSIPSNTSDLNNDSGYISENLVDRTGFTQKFKVTEIPFDTADSYRRRVITLVPVSTVNQSQNRLVSGKITIGKHGGNISDVIEVQAQSVYNNTKANIKVMGYQVFHKLVTFDYNGIQWLGIELDYGANPYNYALFSGWAVSDTAQADQLQCINFYDEYISTITNPEIYNSLSEFTGTGAFRFNNKNVWTESNFDPSSKADISHSHGYQKHIMSQDNGYALNASNDWNNYEDTGFYMGQNLSNEPSVSGIHTWKHVLSQRHNATYSVQRSIDFYGKEMHFRAKHNGSWTAWNRVWHDGNFDPANYLPSSGGTLTSDLKVNGLIDGHIRTYEGGVRKLINPKGGTYNLPTSAIDGALKINLPGHENFSSMLRMIVDVFDYRTGSSFTVTLGGYLYSSFNWVNEFAFFNSTKQMEVTPEVRFAIDTAGYGVVYIGNVTDVDKWDYCVISVRELIIGHSGDDNVEWDNPLNISYATSYGTDAIKKTVYGKQLDAETVNGHKITVGTTAPSNPSTNDIWIDTSGS